MKFLIDADCSRSIGTNLKNSGHEVKDIRDINPSATNQEIYELIKKESYILITRDTDFGNILRYPVTTTCAIILLKVYLLTTDEIIMLIKDLLGLVSEKDFFGSLIIVQKGRYRIRKI